MFASILEFDPAGRLLTSFGADMFIFPHKIYVDHDGNLWVADQRGPNARELAKSPDSKNKGHIVRKFSPDGRVLLTIGTPGVPGDPPDHLTEPTLPRHLRRIDDDERRGDEGDQDGDAEQDDQQLLTDSDIGWAACPGRKRRELMVSHGICTRI